MGIATSRLQGWDYIKSLMKPCKKCGEKPTLGTSAISGRHLACCMNICCANFERYENNNFYLAINEWNKNN